MSHLVSDAVHVAPSVVSRRIGDHLVLLESASGRYYTLDGSAAAIWRQLDTHDTAAAIATALSTVHGVALSEISADVETFLGTALADGLVEAGRRQTTAQTSAVCIHPTRLAHGSIDDLQATFARQHYIQLPQLFDPTLLAQVERLVSAGTFVDREHHGIGTELCLVPGVATGVLQLLFNDVALRTLIGEIAGVPAPGCFDGRVYRMSSQEGHYDSWHSDAGEDRQIAVSVNLSRERYDGGDLEIRRASVADAEWTVSNNIFGSAVMFRISPDLRHRVVPVRGTRPRTAYAGWFRATPRFEDLFLPTLQTT